MKLIYSLVLLLFGTSLYAADGEKAVIEVVKRYAASVACGSEYGNFGFKAVKVAGNLTELSSHEDYFAVVWTGDLGCFGGSGTSGAYISTVAIRAGSTPVVLIESPPVAVATRFPVNAAGGKGMLIIEGAVYKDNDKNCCPSGEEPFIYRFDERTEAMVLLK